MTLEIKIGDVNKILQSRYVAWYPPEKPYGFSWSLEEEGVYKGEPFYRPASIAVNIGDRAFMIIVDKGVLRLTEESLDGKTSLPVAQASDVELLNELFALLLGYVSQSGNPEERKESSVAVSSGRDFLQAMGAGASLDLNERTRGSIEDPYDYFDSHAEDFVHRAIAEPRHDLYQFVLLDGLIRMDKAAELDWKSYPHEVATEVSRISGEEDFDLSAFPVDSMDTAATLASLAAQLKSRGKILLFWEFDTDAYDVLAVGEASVDAVLKAGADLKLRLSLSAR